MVDVFDFVFSRYPEEDEKIEDICRIIEFLLPLKPDQDTVIAVFLNELYFNGFISEEELRERFGNGVAGILSALEKLDSLGYVEYDKSSQVEVLRKMFLTMARDLRVVLIWLARRMLKMEKLSEEKDINKCRAVATETMNIYAPIASRLGIYRMKTSLEDLSFQYLDPEDYRDIKEQIEELCGVRKMAIEKISKELKKFLLLHGVAADVVGRVKSVYGIYRKLKKKNLDSVEDIYDFFAMRIILPVKPDDSVDDLYAVLGLIHSEWKPVSHKFKDYIAVPKPNGYRSLHTVVLGLGPAFLDQPVEIQIRDTEMHKEAEYGVSSHWLYKSKGSSGGKQQYSLDSQVEWIKGLERIHEFFDSEAEIVKEVDVDIFKDRIFVLTPKGDVKDLPKGAVPIDFAYAVHTDVGNRCVMAKVNGSAVPLDYELKNGDVVEIITRKDSEPKLRWLSIVKTNFSRNKIKAWLSELNRENNIKEGKRLLNIQFERLGKPMLDQNYSLLKNFGVHALTFSQRESLLEELGKGAKSAIDVAKKLYPNETPVQVQRVLPRPGRSEMIEDIIEVGGEGGLPLKIAACCGPRVHNDIVGYVTRGNRITVHRASCNLLDKLDPQRFIPAAWRATGE